MIIKNLYALIHVLQFIFRFCSNNWSDNPNGKSFDPYDRFYNLFFISIHFNKLLGTIFFHFFLFTNIWNIKLLILFGSNFRYAVTTFDCLFRSSIMTIITLDNFQIEKSHDSCTVFIMWSFCAAVLNRIIIIIIVYLLLS